MDKKKVRTEAFGLYPFVHFSAALAMHHPVRSRLILFSEASFTFRGFVRSSSLFVRLKFVVVIPAVRSFPYVALFEITDVYPLATGIRFYVCVLVLPTCFCGEWKIMLTFTTLCFFNLPNNAIWVFVLIKIYKILQLSDCENFSQSLSLNARFIFILSWNIYLDFSCALL